MISSLRERLIAFRAAYYRVQIVRGLLLVLLWSGLMFMLFSLTEGIFWWDVPVRRFMWIIWLGGALIWLSWQVIFPLLQYGFKLRGYLSDEEAARWIGQRIPEVRDKLLNALQLAQQTPSINSAIALAIEERMRQLSIIPWEIALPHREVKRYALFLLGLIGLGGLLWVGSPHLFRQGAHRFLRPNQAFARPLPFTLHIEGLKSPYRQGETLTLRLYLSGEKLPTTLSAYTEAGPLSLEKNSIREYGLSIPNLHKSFTLNIEANGQILRSLPIEVLHPPMIKDFTIICQYPPYTRMGTDTFSQPAVRALRGSVLLVSFSIENERPYELRAQGFSLSNQREGWNGMITVRGDTFYKVQISDAFFAESLLIQVESYPDLHPSVQLFAEWFNPDTWEQQLKLRLMDDYGFTRAVLWYRIVEGTAPGRGQAQFSSIPLPISSDATQEASFRQDWRKVGVQPGDKVEYYVEVWDNDAIAGPKSSRSITYTLEPMNDVGRQEVFSELQDSLFQQLSAIRREIQSLLAEKDIAQNAQKATQLSEQFRAIRSELRSLQRLAAEQQLFTPELLRQMEQLQKLLESTDPQKPEQLLMKTPLRDTSHLDQTLEELRRAFEEWQEKLARMEALLPQYQQRRDIEQLMTRLAEIAEQQRQLSQLSDSARKGTENLQSRIEAQTQQLRREVDSLRGRLGSGPMKDSLGSASEALREASEQMQKALENMQQGASPQSAQQKAADALDRALQAMDSGMQQSSAEEEAEEYEALRLLLKGILSLSFRQEQARKKAQEASSFTAAAQPLINEQTNIRRDYRQIHDSLFAIAKRSPAVEEPILDLLREIERYFQNMTFSESELLIRRQQYILQGLNRLANLMTELLAQLEESQRNQQQQGGGACRKPFKVRRKSPSAQATPSQGRQGQRPTPQPSQKNAQMPSPHQLQQQLNDALEKAMTPNPSAETPGGLTPDERARLSAQQEQIRLRLQELIRQNPGDAGKLQSLIEEMQKAEKDLLIGAITRERLMRQQAILTRLLEYERSQQERELDMTRESRTAQQFFQRTTGSYPTPEINAFSPRPTPALWLYQPTYQRLIEAYFK
ncbi:MAG: hypothetical protein NZZ60_04825 [Bacteroidia bacterium]|nr:hypothetical protein [Bacteroidia bacterium]MCX7652765.1 hypothetical protein [Bacteroidia bacterium]MDW8417402.1 DUF4175 family protein [Bacteroidia bacterium]